MSDLDEYESQERIAVKDGFSVRVVEYKTIKLMSSFLTIRSHLGYFINMITSGDGDTLPALQAVPVLFFLIINLLMCYYVYAVWEPSEQPNANRTMFFLIILALVMVVVLLIIIISVIAHAYSTHQKLHDGIVTAMNHYLNSTTYKSQIDRLQIEMQCCGSKKYDEWYTIKWQDQTLEKETGSAADGNAPFSCCSMKSLSPCVHHKIEVTGKAYLYTPEFNLSISTRGCYEMIREKKQKVGWIIVGNLCLYIILEIVTLILFRFIQTAHFENRRFYGSARSYTIWLFGSYSGKVKDNKTPPTPPPVPQELKD
ncbi:rod outer segment membrane protein 1-like isoform X2 [Tribolium madens]|uniref:rod outer segment membrane protein 1-like isoform X2 n=1 Tax=Tribolium madens TaxID=41895 RepID=UPI001CF754F0|nr:rod outer segment membrane protein 1-like isoform X2 [Tribolium madens]